MELLYEWMGRLQMAIFLLAALLIPWWLKRYFWLGLVTIGYILYITWRIYLQAMGKTAEVSSGFSAMTLPYLAGLSLLGYLFQKLIDYRKHKGFKD
ncbi:hypothetical protein BBI11_12505 [Planococcus maritimus]|uniref:hypothetical protein n=1 Tax=Planococcus maritimus TaxID=192421 RepID=UPI00080EFE88|nr:hypothetical protein [Planococcus maritimus]ANU17800.1 hypothetical protein BBI11_12505 [Planococcus maritimus]